MTDQIDAVLTRVVAEAVAVAPAAPAADEVAAYLAAGRERRRSWARPVLAVAAVAALLVAAAAVLLQRDRSAVVVTPASGGSAFVLPAWPEDLKLLSANVSTAAGTTIEPTVHIFQRVNSEPADHELIVVVIDRGPVEPTAPVWDQLDNGDGALSFTIGDVPLTAYPRTTDITEADVRAFAAGLRANGASASTGLDPDSGGDFATVDVFEGGERVDPAPSTSATWSSGDGTVTITTAAAPSGVTDTMALPIVGVARNVNGLSFLECQDGGSRVANWLDPGGTWVSVAVDGSVDLDHVVDSIQSVPESEWRTATGQPASTGS